jgi:hypothetical protein
VGLGTSIFNSAGGYFKSVKWLANKFIACAQDSTNRIAYSYDGITWNVAQTANTIFTTLGLVADCTLTQPHTVYFPQNAVITGNTISYNNGQSWSAIPAISQASNAVGWNGTYYIFAGQSGNIYKATTDLSANIVNQFTNTVPNIIKWNGTQWLLAGSSTTNQELQYSYDGCNWTPTGSIYFNGQGSCNGLVWSGSIWVASGTVAAGNVLMYSADGINWAASDIAPNALGGGPVEWNGSYFLCGGPPGPAGTVPTILNQSSDGLTWSTRQIGSNGPIQSIIWNGSTTWVIATAPPDTSTSGILVSYDGITWTAVGGGVTYNYLGGAWSGLAFVLNTNSSTTRYSYDGTNWTSVVNSAQNGNAVIWTNPQVGTVNIVQPTIVGGAGTYNTMAYSQDGINYRSLGSAVFSVICNRIKWNGSIWVAAGSGTNTLAYSQDGLVWTPLGQTVFSSAAYGLAWSGQYWIALGSGGNTMATSSDGKTWTGLGQTIFDASGLVADWSGQAWVAGGQGSTNTLAYCTNANPATGWIGLGNTLIKQSVNAVRWMANKWSVGGALGTGTNIFGYSTNALGSSGWTASPSGIIMGVSCNSIFWNGQVAVAVGTCIANTIATSVNGINWTGRGNVTFTASGADVMWNTQRWVAAGTGGNTVAYSYNGLTWYGSPTNLFTTGGYSVGANPKIGAVSIPSAICLSANDRFVVNTPKYYDDALSSDTAISFNLNLA